MKFIMLAVTGIILFVIVFFGFSLISNEQSKMSDDVINSPEYQQQAAGTEILISSFAGIPIVVFVFAALAGIVFFAHKAGVV